MKIINRFTKRCRHRHSIDSHPHCFIKETGEPIDRDAPKLPKILIFDIETAPLQAFIFQKSVWGGNVTDSQVISEWFMLCWSAKWLFNDNIMSERLTGKESVNENDARIVKSLWTLLDQADIVIAHNAAGFDVPNMNTRLIVNGLPPTSPYQIIDTKIVAKKQFGFTHNSLNGLAKIAGFEPKMETDFELWKRCVRGEDEALEYMEKYNRGDVELLENIYLWLRPWIKAHPNLGLYVESTDPICPNCGSTDLKWITDKFYYTTTSKFPLYRCECGSFGRLRKSVLPKEVKKNLVLSLGK